MREADYIFDIGPAAGENGGYVTAQGTCEEIMKDENSTTGKFLSGRESVEIPKERRKSDKYLKLSGAKGNNLKNVNLSIPLGIFTAVTLVS